MGGNKIGRRPERLPIASLVQLSERCAIDPRPSYLLGFEYRMRGLSMKTRERYPASIPTYTPCYRGFAISSVLSVGVRIIYSVSDRPTAGPHGAEAARELRRGFPAYLVGSPEITKDLHHTMGLDRWRAALGSTRPCKTGITPMRVVMAISLGSLLDLRHRMRSVR